MEKKRSFKTVCRWAGILSGCLVLTGILFLGAEKVRAEEAGPEAGKFILDGKGASLSLDSKSGELLLFRQAGDEKILTGRAASGGYLRLESGELNDFRVETCQVEEGIQGVLGKGNRMTISSVSASTGVRRIYAAESSDAEKGLFYTSTSYVGGNTEVQPVWFVENQFVLEENTDTIWSYNGGGEGRQSYYDTLQKITIGDSERFYRENRQDEGAAGIPAADIYSARGGITVGDASAGRRELRTPVEETEDSARLQIQRPGKMLKPGQTVKAGESFVAVHDGDYYQGLRAYARGMKKLGFDTLSKERISDMNYDLRWESWGWEFDWTKELVIGKLDELEKMGIRQVTLDDGWYQYSGEWNLNPDKLSGDQDMKDIVDAIHSHGMTAVLWWRPCDGGPDESDLYRNHKDYFVMNKNGTIAGLPTPGGESSISHALCPGSEGALNATRNFIRKAMTVWGFDGFKSDYVWSMPKCYQPSHHHEDPGESTQRQADFYRAVYETMQEIRPDGLHLLCNCGTPQDYYSLPYVTQIPTADPTSVDQTRRRVKAYKALAGDDFPITTDHNVLWYPSTIGTGAVMIEKRDLKGAQEADYEKWVKIARREELQKGTFIGDLYSYGFDPYETYVVEKDGTMYYAFYRDGSKFQVSGNPQIELKGLDPAKQYRIVDYVNDQVVATNVSGSHAALQVPFEDYLLVKAVDITGKPDAVKEKADDRDGRIIYEGSWVQEKNSQAYLGTATYTEAEGSSIEMTFQGTNICWYGQKDSNFGTAAVLIDGEFKEEVQCADNPRMQVKLFETEGLVPGEHTIKIECRKKVIDIDWLEFWTEVPETPDPDPGETPDPGEKPDPDPGEMPNPGEKPDPEPGQEGGSHTGGEANNNEIQVPGKVKRVKTISKTASITVTWPAVKGAVSYLVERKQSGKWYAPRKVTGTKATFKKLKKNASYAFRVKAVGVKGAGPASDICKTGTAPGRVKGVRAVKLSGKVKKITWKRVKGADGYYVYMKTGKKAYRKIYTVEGGTKTAYKKSKLKRGASHRFKVTAYYSYGKIKVEGA